MTTSRRRLPADALALALVALAWIGVWGAWIPHLTAGLTQNAPRLAYWSGVLPEVRGGSLALMPDMLRLAMALAAVALAVSAGSLRSVWLRWAVRIVALLPGLVLLPPYPYVLDLWNSEPYGRRFIIALVVWIGVPASGLLDLLEPGVRRITAAVLALAGAVLGAWTFTALRGPFAARYAEPIAPGWGVIAFSGGLIAAALLLTVAIFQQPLPPENKNGPVS